MKLAKIFRRWKRKRLYPAEEFGKQSLSSATVSARRTLIEESGLFDTTFYLANYLDVALAQVDPLEHYVMYGSAELRQPSLDFDPNAYLAANPDVAAAGAEAIVHFINCGRAEGRSWAQSELRTADVPSALCRIRASGFFDKSYYLKQCPLVRDANVDPVLHYLVSGFRDFFEPSPTLSMQAYLAEHPDVRASGCNPLLHLIDHGRDEDGKIRSEKQSLSSATVSARRTLIEESGLFDTTFYLANYLDVALAQVDPLEHYVMYGSAELRQPSLDFDPNAYLAANPDVAAAGAEAIVHFINCGRAEGRSWAQSELRTADVPSALCRIRASGFFDKSYYLKQCPLVRDANVDPVLHYLVSGFRDFFEPSPTLSMQAYVAEHPDVRASGCNPLLHLIDHGRDEDRKIRSDLSAAKWLSIGAETTLPDSSIFIERMAGIAFFRRFGFAFEGSSSLGSYFAAAVEELAATNAEMTIDRLDPDVSIIIPVHGQLPFILNCLEFALAASEQVQGRNHHHR